MRRPSTIGTKSIAWPYPSAWRRCLLFIAQDAFEPQTWEEVLSKAEERAEARLMQRLEPILNDMTSTTRSLTKSETERRLDSAWPEWRQYESEMIEVLNQHPTLANDPEKLAELATPGAVKESKAYKRALETLRAKEGAARVSGPGTGVQATPSPQKARTFNEAYIEAKRALGR